MTGWILASLALLFVQTLLPSIMRARTGEAEQKAYLRGNRDTRPPAPVMAERMERALRNLFEALPIFLALALLAEIRGIDSGLALWGAGLFVIARVAYVPGYGAGIPPLRSIIWFAGHIGLILMAIGLFTA